MIILNIILWVKEWSIFKFAKINMAKKYLIMIKQVSTTLLMDRTDPAKDVKVESASRKTFKAIFFVTSMVFMINHCIIHPATVEPLKIPTHLLEGLKSVLKLRLEAIDQNIRP